MKATPKAILSSFESLKQRLAECNLLRDWNGSVIERSERGRQRITWATTGTRPELSDISTSNIKEYLLFLEGRHFQFMLTDGSLIQMSYDVQTTRNEIKTSRLVWYPCPVVFSPEELEFATINELVLTSPVETLSMQAPLRFDYSPEQEAENHSCTHLHLGTENFRMPVQRALEPSRFMRLIIRTAYPKIWSEFAHFREAEDWGSADRLTDDDKLFGSLSWHLPIAL
ncbi:hypothetical protein SAMN05216412_101180 [Nitrosospira multiformis]|uniref:DUF2290 domain-containing protein n=1 Tax=Nitrosospira multiformis TaxID=1231 RepID=A0A1H9YF72_9PROT|nr:DUF2290 domain-containing protein [Nitrosospira multiformis]SES67205.1 hypothetical protein SAMN05216412_101180 [Nitrosospira multiformis]